MGPFWRILRWSCLLFCLLTARVSNAASAQQLLIKNWTRDDGLPSGTVTAVAQSPGGYLWVGTSAGLSQFDGMRFKSLDLRQVPGLHDQAVVCLSADHGGSLWIGLADGHLVRLREGVLSAFLPPSRETAYRYLQQVVEDRDRSLWTLNHEGSLNRLVGGVFKPGSDRADLIGLAEDIAGRVWVAGPGDLQVSEAGHWVSLWDRARQADFSPGALAPARNGGCWVAGNGCVRRFDAGRWVERYQLAPGEASVVSSLLEDGEGRLWLGSDGGGLVLCDKGYPTRRITQEQGLPGDRVRCLFEDREGNLWVGLEGKGLARVRTGMFSSYGRAEGLSGERVLCVCEGRAGEVWLGTDGHGVQRIQAGQIQHYGKQSGLSNECVSAVCRDRSGRLWVGTRGGGLFALDGERFIATGAELGFQRMVLALHEDVHGRLWLGEQTGPGRWIEALEQGRRQTLPVPGKLPRLEVCAIAETGDGSLWFGTGEEGLWRWQAGTFTHYGAQQGLPPGRLNTLYVDHIGTLWAAVAGAGLALWNREQFVSINASDGLPDENLTQVTDDGLGYLWCGSERGVFRVKQADLWRLAQGRGRHVECRLFTRTDGLPSDECTGQGCRTRDGRIWFATSVGVAAVDPRHVMFNPVPPPVVVEEVLLNGMPFSAGEKPPAGAPLRIRPGWSRLAFHYTALNFTAPARVRFNYRLRGFDETWVEAGIARRADYNYLPPGSYRFDVIACNEDNVWNRTGASLAFMVLPHYWQTWWFRLGILGGMLGATASSVRLVVTRRLRRRLARLERQRTLEQERARIAQDLHDDLGTSLTEIHFLSAVARSPSISPAQVKVRLESIAEKALEMIKALDEIVWAVNPKNDALPNLVNYLCLFAQHFLKPTAIRCRLDVSPDLPDLSLNAEQRHTLFLLTKEALANAAKHSGASELWLRVTQKSSRLTLVIEDNGRGFDPATLKQNGNGSRNGFKNIEARMKHLGGCGVVRGALGQGTRVELDLPLR